MLDNLLLADADVRQLLENFIHWGGAAAWWEKKNRGRKNETRSLVGVSSTNLPAFSTSVIGWKNHATRRAQINALEDGFIQQKSFSHRGKVGDLLRRCSRCRCPGAVRPCSAGGGADRTYAAFWNATERPG